ncbi:type I pullulanase [soil metagenome]
MLTIHYHRFDGDYEGVSLWTWDKEHGLQPPEQDVFPAGWDDFGPYFRLNPDTYGGNEHHRTIGIVPRLRSDWNAKDGSDRFWTPTLGLNLWLVGGDSRIYRERPDTSPRVQAAYLDADKMLTLRLSHGTELSRLIPSNFRVRSVDGSQIPVLGVRAVDPVKGAAKMLQLALEKAPESGCHFMALAEGYRPATGVLRNVLLDETLYKSDLPLGPIYTPQKTTFRVFAPTASAAHVTIYDHPTGALGRVIHDMTSAGKGVWETEVAGDLHGKHYTLFADADGPHGRTEVVDPHCRCTTGHDGHGKIVDLRRLDPPDFRPIKRPATIEHPTDAVIWEVSVRDFTRHYNSGVEEKLRGKFAGAALRGTTIPNTNIKTGIDHLMELGVTHVQLLPIQDFDNHEGSNDYNWGYMTSNFSSPDGWYASNPRDDSRVREFKELVAAFHAAGIRVIMDVVYNHTAPDAAFEALAPRYYLRRREDGTLFNGSGTGNEFRSEAPMARKFIVDSCRYWVEEYGVDGFRFDLLGLIDINTLTAVRDALIAIDPNLLVYGEPWAAAGQDGVGLKPITYKSVVSGHGIGAFNDHFRNDLKGGPDGADPGYIQTGANRDAVKQGIAASIHDWATQPGEAIQYATCHDNLTLYDKLKASAPTASEADLAKMQILTAAILAVSQGVFFLHGGHELLRTKKGNHNSYDAPDDINQIDWSGKQRHPEVFASLRNLIALRRAHPLFRLRTREEIEMRLRFRDDLCPNDRCIAFTIDGAGVAREAWRQAFIVINPGAEAASFRAPAGDWNLVFENGESTGNSPRELSGSVIVEARSIAVAAN